MTDDDAARRTYRYVRLGMVGAVLLLAASVSIERSNAPRCWQTSISAYYYTPVRAIFVGALVAVGLSLIVIKGSTTAEDICLNAAGMLAPVVALVPTSGAGSCWSVKPDPRPTYKDGEDTELARWVITNIDNNVGALLIAGVFGLLLATVIAVVAMKVRRPPGQEMTVRHAVRGNKGTIVSLVVAAGALAGFAIWRERSPEVFNERSHGIAAVVMFAFLAGAAFANAWDTKNHGRHKYAAIYVLIGLAMITTAALFLVPDEKWAHKVLWIEILEITWFLLLWIVQSRELWHDTLRRSDHATAPFTVLPFDKRGACTAPADRRKLLEEASTEPYTDVFLFAHGWNNTWRTALRHYDEFVKSYQAFRQAQDLPVPEGYRPLLVGIYWPSAILSFDYEDPPAPAADGGPVPIDPSDEQALAVLDDEVAAGDYRAIRALAEANGAPDEELAALLAPLLTDDDEVGAPAPTAAQLLEIWRSSGRSFEGTGDFGAIGGAGEGVAAAGFFSTARDAIRQITVWLMKDRAGRVGARGVAPLLSDLQEAAPAARFHLVGHSYGCKLLLSALAIEPPDRKVDSLLLLQAAVNHRCFAADRGDGRPGGYAVVLDRVVAPIVVTFSDKDTSLRTIFHWLMRRPDDLGEVAIAADDGVTPPSRFAALGGWGPVGAEPVTARLPMRHAKDVYEELRSSRVRILALASHDDITSHGAIANPGTYWALYCSTVAGVLTPTP